MLQLEGDYSRRNDFVWAKERGAMGNHRPGTRDAFIYFYFFAAIVLGRNVFW